MAGRIVLAALLSFGTVETPPAPRAAVVVVETLDVLDAPGPTAMVTGRLHKGDRLVVLGEGADGWLAIAPPAGSFGWVDREAVDNRGVVVAEATVRAGSSRARLPGAPRGVLAVGTVVRRLDRLPLTLGRGATSRTFVAIAPTADDVRFVRTGGVEVSDEAARDPRPPARRSEPPAPIDRDLFATGPVGDESRLGGELTASLAAIEAEHRRVLRLPVERWRLDGVRRRYEGLLRGVPDPPAQSALRGRLERVRRQQEVAEAAATLETILQRNRARQRGVEAIQGQLGRAEPPNAAAHDAVGLLQVSSRQHDGERLYALISASGETEAYLRLPPGLSVDRLLTRRVGVKGRVAFDEDLRARLIRVQDLVPLPEARGVGTDREDQPL